MFTFLIMLTMVMFTKSSGGESYYGTHLGSFPTRQHSLQGVVYIVDKETILINNFVYDGYGPKAYFWVDTKASPTLKGKIAPRELGGDKVLPSGNNDTLLIKAPKGSTWKDYKSLSVYCVDFAANFGEVQIPGNVLIPEPKSVGPFNKKNGGLQHGLSGSVVILNPRKLQITDLNYDGLGPAAWFYVGKGSQPDRTTITNSGYRLTNENGESGKLRAYKKETIEITLPSHRTVFDVDWFTIWCDAATVYFGLVEFKNLIKTNIPPFLPMVLYKDRQAVCQQLSDDLQVTWGIDENEDLIIELAGAIDVDPLNYMAFGFNDKYEMVGSDVVVAYYLDGPKAVEYYLSAKSQCSNGQGVCPESRNDAKVVKGVYSNGITRIKYTRKLKLTGSNDKSVTLGNEQQIVWAIGSINKNDNNLAYKHSKVGGKKITFSKTTPSQKCEELKSKTTIQSKPWAIPKLIGAKTNTSAGLRQFNVAIGVSGPANHGYAAITGRTSWGIAYYINGLLIPEITLYPGVEYTFVLNSGNDDKKPTEYHPFYITTSSAGGYGKNKNDDEKILAGLINDTAVNSGTFCEYTLNPNKFDLTKDYKTFEEYQKVMTYSCNGLQSSTILKFTPSTDMLEEIYYQCYVHKYLGWKIKVAGGKPLPTNSSPMMNSCNFLLFCLITYLLTIRYF